MGPISSAGRRNPDKKYRSRSKGHRLDHLRGTRAGECQRQPMPVFMLSHRWRTFSRRPNFPAKHCSRHSTRSSPKMSRSARSSRWQRLRQQDALRKMYRYVIQDGRLHDPFMRMYAWFVRQLLDVEAMRRASQCLVGRMTSAVSNRSGRSVLPACGRSPPFGKSIWRVHLDRCGGIWRRKIWCVPLPGSRVEGPRLLAGTRWPMCSPPWTASSLAPLPHPKGCSSCE